MRKIMFRGMAISSIHQKKEWVYGFYHNTTPVNTTNHYIKYEGIDVLVDPDTVGEFTGVHDKNGKPIFEGDIIEFVKGQKRKDVNSEWEDDKETVLVEFDGGSFSCAGYCESEDAITIIGNKYENPELVK